MSLYSVSSISGIDVGETPTGISPITSGKQEVLEHTTGIPHDIASSTGKPQNHKLPQS